MQTSYQDGAFGRVRSRTVGRVRGRLPEVVLVQGLAVADYLLPGLASLGEWTRGHLVELPGLSGSGEPPHELDVSEYGHCVADWLDRRRLGGVVLAGHSSGTQVAARAAARSDRVAGLALASPTVDPAVATWLRLFAAWRRDGRIEPPGLTRVHLPEWRRAGPRRLLHLIRVHLADRLDEALPQLRVPLLVIRGREDAIGSRRWARRLAARAPDGEYVEVPGGHTFPWLDPHAWSDPLRRFAARLAPAARSAAGR